MEGFESGFKQCGLLSIKYKQKKVKINFKGQNFVCTLISISGHFYVCFLQKEAGITCVPCLQVAFLKEEIGASSIDTVCLGPWLSERWWMEGHRTGPDMKHSHSQRATANIQKLERVEVRLTWRRKVEASFFGGAGSPACTCAFPWAKGVLV